MLRIYFPDTYVVERSYVADIIFGDFLGLHYKLLPETEINHYKISLSNGANIVFEDDFFGKFHEKSNYINKLNLPEKILLVQNDFAPKKDLPILYGSDSFTIDNQNIKCEYDIFASIFFMLSRWEENIDSQRDEHDRFVEENSVSIKNNFHQRPIVDEYTDFIWNLLKQLGYEGERKERKTEIVATHDIDFFERYHNTSKIIRALAGDIFKRGSLKMFFQTIVVNINIKRREREDPFDTFDEFMNRSEKMGVKSRFYFIAGKLNETDVHYDIQHPRVVKKIKEIKERGHIVGIHGSYDSYNNPEQFQKELERLQNITNGAITEGRQHFLRFRNPDTWRMYEKAGLKIDSTMGFSRHVGYRCGTGETFPVLDILHRQKLNLKEMPLIVMDCAIPDKQELITNKGQLTTLWHNSEGECDFICRL